LTRRFLDSILPYLKQVAGLLIIGSIGGIVMNTAVVLPAVLLGRAIDAATATGYSPPVQGRVQSADVLRAGLAYAGAVALYQGARVVKRWGLRVGNQRIMASVRADALRGVLDWPIEQLSRTPIGDLMARIIGDVEVFGRGVRELTTEIWDTVLFSVSLIVAMMVYDPALTLLVLLPVPVGMLLAQAAGRWVSARTRASREASAALTAFFQERLAGLRVVRLFGRLEATVARAATLADRLAEANLSSVRLRAGLQPIYRLIMMSGVVLLLWLGARRVALGVMTLGAFVAYLDLYTRFVGRGHRVPQLFNSVQSGAAAYERLQPLLAPPRIESITPLSTLRVAYVPGLEDPLPSLPERAPHPAALSIQDVSFRYPGSQAAGHKAGARETGVLDRVSLDVPAGALIAITGPVGCGKSALARVLLGLYPLSGGQVLLDGVPLDGLSAAERAARIGYLPQNPFLFSGTVRDNVLLSPAGGAPVGPAGGAPVEPAGGAPVENAGGAPVENAGGAPVENAGGAPVENAGLERYVALAALDQDVHTFPNGLDTEIGERGVRVSGGQRQRIALARAFAVRPSLLVLDDPFSAVDLDTEARIVSGLREAFGATAPVDRQATIVFFSHRLAAFPMADRVVVLDEGRIVQAGTHQVLLDAGGLYARIYQAQISAAQQGAAQQGAAQQGAAQGGMR
jgi:ABC-type multidrug transport system fused ATPase/permease subunit